MQIIRKRAFARAGLVGNPSDGYHGKTVSLIVQNYCAEVVLYEWDDLEIVPSQDDHSRFASIAELAGDVRLHGYYGGIRLVKAAIKSFHDYCRGRHELHARNFSIRYESDIPRLVGLAGSSAIVVATLRALMEYYGIAIPERVLPSLALRVETRELGIGAGLQDRVIQVYEGMVYMDFSEAATDEVDGFECGRYERLELPQPPPLYVAYRADASEPTERLHNDLRSRFRRGDRQVVDAMKRFAELAVEARRALLQADWIELSRCIDENFDLRRSICDLSPDHVEMIETARAAGASAKFAGSGGAIIGTCGDDGGHFEQVASALETIGCVVFRPMIGREPM